MTPRSANIRVAITYRVLQGWRVPIFQRLAQMPGIDLHVFYGDEYAGSKLKNTSAEAGFRTTKLKTFKFRIRTRNGVARIPIQFGLGRALKHYDPDVVITEGASHLFGNLASFLYCRRHGKALIQWGLGTLQERQLSRWRRLADLLFFKAIERRSQAAIAYSSRGGVYYRGIGMPAESVFVAVNTVDTESRMDAINHYCTTHGLEYPSPVPDHFKVIFIGALTEGKKVDLLLSAFALFLEDHPNATLQIVGDGDARQSLEAHARQLGLGDRIEFVGHVSGDLPHFFYDASVMVLPGLGGLAVSDALCHGVPVLCHIGDGSEADLIDGSNGRILPEMSPKTLAKALGELAENQTLQAEWRAGALRMIEQKYNVRTYVSGILAAIDHAYEVESK